MAEANAAAVVLGGRYRLEALVGSGGMAAVYRGFDELLQRPVAVKVLREEYAQDPAFLARFMREARAAARLHHPNIVTVYDVGEDGGRYYIVMEYVDGQDLKTLIRQRGRLSVPEALEIAIQICRGAAHAHKAGVIHCDIKPQNVLLTREGVAKVTDFGIARALSAAGLTQAETVWGSPQYLAPEQAAGEPPSPASDVYSIGVTLYEMLAGVPPFQAESAAALALMHLRQEPPPLGAQNPQVGPQLEWIVRKVLAKEPAARYRTAEHLAYVLEQYRRQGEQPTGWQPAQPQEPYAADGDTTLVVRPPARAGADGLTLLLSVLAAVAVLGLIPLWALVYRAYTAPAPLPLPTPTLPLAGGTPTPAPLPVPAVVGRPVEEACRTLEAAGLRCAVEDVERLDVAPGSVLEQQPAAGASVPPGTEVLLRVARRRALVMPAVVGYFLSEVQAGLEGDGLRVVAAPIWSQQPQGLILAQEPAPGRTVYAGDLVTLTVSGPPETPIPLEVNLAGRILLVRAQLARTAFRPGDPIDLTLYWRALQPPEADCVVFVHLLGPDGALVAQQDVPPPVSTLAWQPGMEVLDPHRVVLPPQAPPGRYQLRVGMYPAGEPGARLEVVDPGRATDVAAHSILITPLDVSP